VVQFLGRLTNRHKFIDVEKYQIEVFGKVKSMKRGK
jgi:hypothetical protein